MFFVIAAICDMASVGLFHILVYIYIFFFNFPKCFTKRRINFFYRYVISVMTIDLIADDFAHSFDAFTYKKSSKCHNRISDTCSQLSNVSISAAITTNVMLKWRLTNVHAQIFPNILGLLRQLCFLLSNLG